MAKITLQGNEINTNGNLLKVGDIAPSFSLVKNDLSEVGLDNYKGKRKVINIFPSIDTPVCATSVRSFNKNASEADNTVVLNVSADLPFALGRFCAAEGLTNVEVLSSFRSDFANLYNVQIIDGPLSGLCSRAVIVLDEKNNVIYSEQVLEIASEPNYSAALSVLK